MAMWHVAINPGKPQFFRYSLALHELMVNGLPVMAMRNLAIRIRTKFG